MTTLTLVTIENFGSDVALYKDGQIVITADPDCGDNAGAVREVGERLALIEDASLNEVPFSPEFEDWSWEDVTIILLEQEKLGFIDLSYLSTWKNLYSEGNTSKDYPAWLKEYKKAALIEGEEAEIDTALRQVFGDDAIDRVNKAEDPYAYDMTVCLSAYQRLTYFAEIAVPGSCTDADAEKIAEMLNIDAANYEMDEEYWEDGIPTIC